MKNSRLLQNQKIYKKKSSKKNIYKKVVTKRKPVRTRRFKKQITFKRIFNSIKTGVKILIAAAVFWGIYIGILKIQNYLYTSDHFKIKSIKVKKNNIVSKKYITNLFHNYCISISEPEQVNIFKIDTEKLCRYILNSSSTIKNIIIQRQLPDSLIFYVDEYIPVAVLRGANSKFYYLDDEGNVFNTALSLADYPIITGLENVKLKIGANSENKKIIECIQLINAIPSYLKSIISEINYKENNTYIFTINHIKIKLGLDNYPAKFERMHLILNNFKNTTLKYIDLRFKNVYIKRS